jgi:hypothetical protein
MAQNMTQELQRFVELHGGKPVHTWTGPGRRGRTQALVVCTNAEDTGLVVAVLDDDGDGAVITLSETDATQLAGRIAQWLAGDL